MNDYKKRNYIIYLNKRRKWRKHKKENEMKIEMKKIYVYIKYINANKLYYTNYKVVFT